MNDQPWVTRASPVELWRIFSPSLTKQLIAVPGAPDVRPVLSRMLLKCGGPRNLRVGEVYEQVFAHLSNGRASEYVYKNALLQRSVLSRHGSKRSRVFFEFRAGKSKLDALVALDSMHAYEIKTDLDHFRRLPTQIADYQQRFAYVSVLTSARGATRLEAQLPTTVGIAILSKRGCFETVRDASRNVAHLRADSILECLRRSEYLKVVRAFGFHDLDFPNTLVHRESMKFSLGLDPVVVHEATLGVLKERKRGLTVKALASLPLFVRAAAVSSRHGDEDIAVLLGNLARKVN